MHPPAQRTEAVAVGGGRAISGSSGGQIAVLGDALPPRRLAAHEGQVWDLDADDAGFVSAGGDTVRVWDTTGELLEERTHPDVRAVVRRGGSLCSAGRDQTLRCDDRQRAFDERINVMAADADGALLVLGLGRFAFPGRVALVAARTLEVRATAATRDSVTAVAFGEGRVAAAFGRGEVVGYDLEREEVRRFDPLGGGIDGRAFRAGTVVALSIDGDYAIWPLPSPATAPAVRVPLGVEGYDLAIDGDQAYLGMSAGALWTFAPPAAP